MPNELPSSKPGLFDLHVFVEPKTLEVAHLFAVTFSHMLSIRRDCDWIPVAEGTSYLNRLDEYLHFEVDWDIDSELVDPSDSIEDLQEHLIVEAFDNGSVSKEMIEKYCYLSSSNQNN